MKNIFIIISLVFSVNTLLASYVITRQGQLNNFQYDSIIYGDLTITTSPGQDSSNMVYDLSPLLGVDTIKGDLIIKNSALTNFSGLRNIVVTGGLFIYDNVGLKDLSSLDGPKQVDAIQVFDNPSLNICTDFSNIMSFSQVKVFQNPKLQSLLFNLQTLKPTWENVVSIYVDSNSSLEFVKIYVGNVPLRTILVINNAELNSIHVSTSNDSVPSIWIKDLPELISVSGFKEVRVIGMLNILDNPKLQNLCFVKQILEKDGVGFMTLSNNGQGANSETEILNTDCTDFNTGIGEINAFEELSFYPNPVHDELFIEGLKNQETYFIYDVSGKVINQGMVDLDGRISISGISNGMYVLMVGNQRSKLIVY
jgi:hypothetical protein